MLFWGELFAFVAKLHAAAISQFQDQCLNLELGCFECASVSLRLVE